VRKVLIERYADSEQAKRAVYLVGANFHALAFYEQAADYYEQFARRFPGEDGSSCTDTEREAGLCAIASEALQNAVFFRLGLNQPDKAEADVRLFARSYKRRLPRQTSEVVFALGSIYERAESWSRVIAHYKRFLREYRRAAMPPQVISANLKIAMAYWSLDRKDDAKRFFQAAARAWETAPDRINALDGTQAEKIGWLREALDGTAQSLFHLAEYKYAEFRRIRFPRYSGGRSLDRVNTWAQNEFMTWITAKQTALRETEALYNAVAALRVPVTEAVTLESPPWQIAAAARIGQMYISIIDAVQDAPIPEEIESDPELFDIYVGAFDDPLEPVRAQAISKFEFCLRTATNVRWFNEYSTICETELNRLNPRQYPVAAELRGAPSYMNAPFGDPGAVELSTGEDEEEPDADGAAAAGGES
jgi:tetratricopeptide (TPR) repeat protein